jgi:hypothetical protein
MCTIHDGEPELARLSRLRKSQIKGLLVTTPPLALLASATGETVRCDEPGVPSASLAKTRTPPEQEKGGVLGNPHRHLPGEPEGLRRVV